MKTQLALLLFLALLNTAAMAASVGIHTTTEDEEDTAQLVDDWQFSSLVDTESMPQKVGAMPAMASQKRRMSAVPQMAVSRTLGFAVGGAKDSDNFFQNLENGYLPKYDSLTYEGLFYDYYFDTGAADTTCNQLFCPSFARGISSDLYSGETTYYLSVGLNSGLDEKSFQRKKLNLVVVLDISGSMRSGFDNYYYDGTASKRENREKTKSKMELANQTIVSMMSHLHKDDRFGVVLFDNTGYLAKPLRLVGQTNMDAIRKHILEITPRGGTNWQAGYEEGTSLFTTGEIEAADPQSYENRIIFITDAMPNTGELQKDGLFGMVRDAAKRGIYTSFIGVGVDFNPELVEYVTKTRGANYFSVHSAAEFKKRLADEFDFMVTPLVFDLELQLASNDYAIEGVYGSPEADLATGKVMKINTLFPSAAEDDAIKGGVVLIKLKKTGTGNGTIGLTVSYTDRSGKRFKVSDSTTFTTRKGFDNQGIRKAVLLSEYVSLLKNWLLDARKGCNDQVQHPVTTPLFKCGLINPETRPEISRLSPWERKSCPLTVSAGYRNFFTLFSKHFQEEVANLNDQTLKKEVKFLALLKEKTATSTHDKPVDDWQGRKLR